MLRHLQIRNFAIIEELELDFSSGLTVLTGETGAGKSIIVDALELLCGSRAAADVIRSGAERADIIATLDTAQIGGELRHLLDEHAIDVGGDLTLRRVVTTDGRSRAWIDGTAVPIQVLRDVSRHLFDIHGQHEFQSLVRADTQRELVDTFGRHEALLVQVRTAHSVWAALLNRSLALQKAADDRGVRLDLVRDGLATLDALALKDGEFAALKDEQSRHTNRGRLGEAVHLALASLDDSEAGSIEPAEGGPTGNARELMARALTHLRHGAAVDARLNTVVDLVDEAVVRAAEAAQTLRQYLEDLEFDPRRADQIQSRLAAIEEAARRQRVTPAELPQRHAQLADELHLLENASGDLAALKTQLAAEQANYLELARSLTARRKTAARALAQRISRHMQELGMAGGRFLIDTQPAERDEPAPHGLDRIEFRVSTNAGQPPRAVGKVASGGELARLSLAVQVACAAHSTPCMIFDEVDAGIGGAVAEIVGRELRALGQTAQVLCVTHLPQVAAQGHQHLRVVKQSSGNSTRTRVEQLGAEEREGELARMLGGIEITSRAREHAREMLDRAGQAAEASGKPRR